MESHISSPLLLIFLCLLASAAAEDKAYSDCGPFKFVCGSITNITYPFLAIGRPAICGHPSFYLTCENDLPVMQISGKPFVVLEINYSSRAITILSKNISDYRCPIPYSGLQFAASTFLYAGEDSYIDVYHDCKINMTDPGFHEIPCLRDISGRPGYYTYPSRGPPSWFGQCSPSTIDIMQAGLNRLQKDPAAVAVVVNEGFRLTWDAGDRWCGECVQSGGRCGYSPEPGGITCYCVR